MQFQLELGTRSGESRRYRADRAVQKSGQLLSGESAQLTARDTTVATAIDLTDAARLALVIDLYAENQTGHAPNRHTVKVKEVRVEAASETDPHKAQLPLAEGKLLEIHADAKKVTIQHDEIESLSMPPMVMIFDVADDAWLTALRPGDEVLFGIGERGGLMIIDRLVPAKQENMETCSDSDALEGVEEVCRSLGLTAGLQRPSPVRPAVFPVQSRPPTSGGASRRTWLFCAA